MNTSDWASQAREWIAASLYPEPVERIEVIRERVWSTNWRVSTPVRAYWFKRNHPGLAHEVPLTELLARSAPNHVAAPKAATEEHCWLLVRDCGPTLASLPPGQKPRAYVELAAALAQVQASASEEEVSGVGLATFEPTRFAEVIGDHLDYCAGLPRSSPLRLGLADARRIQEAARRLEAKWRELEPDALGVDHNDLHLGNAYAGPIIGDWGDAVLAHPFSTLRTIVIISRRMFGEDTSWRVRAAYLTAMGRTEPEDWLRLDLAMQLAVAQRFFSWRQLADPAALSEYAHFARPLLAQLGTPIRHQIVP